jgi:hypothetical protein
LSSNDASSSAGAAETRRSGLIFSGGIRRQNSEKAADVQLARVERQPRGE